MLSGIANCSQWVAAQVDGIKRIEEQLVRVLPSMPRESRRLLLDTLTLPDDARAKAIDDLYRDGQYSALCELAIDLEEDRQARALIARLRGEMELHG